MDYLKRYKTDHAQTNLPKEANDNGSTDTRIWKLGPLSYDPLVWHRFRYALSHHLLGHKESPYDEAEARHTEESSADTEHSVRNPPATAHIDPLFVDPIEITETEAGMRALNRDKSPGPDGITNRMLTGGGDHFNELLHELLSSLWQYEIQPKAWELSLMQPIYKGDNKLKSDPASYRGIYLSSSIAKLFEGLILHRLTQYTEAHETLTENQLGTRPGRQTHDAIYALLAIIQYNWIQEQSPTYVAFLDFSTAYPSVHRSRLATMLYKVNIVGKMWHHLCARFNSARIRVLHPHIPPHQTLPVLRGLPEGSRLSPTLFGIFVADLIHHLKIKFPNSTIHHNGQPLWIGGFLYVDDLCLISTSAEELQQMLTECQTWSEKARMQLNGQKSKVMAFHETAKQKKKRKAPIKSRRRQTGSPTTYPSSFHVLASFPLHRQCTHLLKEVKEFDYLGLRLDPKLDMSAALGRIKQKVNKSQALVEAVSHSLRYDDSSQHHRPSLNANPLQMLTLWKACVLPHLLQNLRYLHEPQVEKLQVALNKSLARSLHVYGYTTALCADMGVPPLRLTQQIHLARLHFRWSHVYTDTIPGTLYKISMSHLHNLPEEAIEKKMRQAKTHMDPQLGPHYRLPPPVQQAKEENREKSYHNWLKVQASKLWLQELTLLTLPSAEPGRMPAYVRLNGTDLSRISLYKPAPYLRQHHGHALDLVRLRAQAWKMYIPTHLHYDTRHAREDYMHRYCGYCQQKEVLGDETHILLVCPTTEKLRNELIPQLERKLRLLDGPLWSSLTDNDRASVMLGNPPPSLLQKHIKTWMEESMPLIHSYTTALLTLLRGCKPPPDSPRPNTVRTNATNSSSSSSSSPPSSTSSSSPLSSRPPSPPSSPPSSPESPEDEPGAGEEDRVFNDAFAHAVRQAMAEQGRSLPSQPLATAGGLPLHVPTAIMMHSEDDEGESTRD